MGPEYHVANDCGSRKSFTVSGGLVKRGVLIKKQSSVSERWTTKRSTGTTAITESSRPAPVRADEQPTKNKTDTWPCRQSFASDGRCNRPRLTARIEVRKGLEERTTKSLKVKNLLERPFFNRRACNGLARLRQMSDHEAEIEQQKPVRRRIRRSNHPTRCDESNEANQGAEHSVRHLKL